MLIRGTSDSIPLADGTVQSIVTSPPYWQLRDYHELGQLGLEATPEEYVARMVAISREFRRVLRPDGALWLNLGDSYIAERAPPGLKRKDLAGIPWRVALALQADGWWLRADVVWSKPNPMPESATDRPVRSHEYVFLLTPSERYYFDHIAIREALAPLTMKRLLQATFDQQTGGPKDYGTTGQHANRSTRRALVNLKKRVMAPQLEDAPDQFGSGRNSRTVWEIPTIPFPESHFATFPPRLPERCILASTEPGAIVLDPFVGSGTTVMVAERLGRRGVGMDLSQTYLAMAAHRIANDKWQPSDPLGAAQAVAATAGDATHQTVLDL